MQRLSEKQKEAAAKTRRTLNPFPQPRAGTNDRYMSNVLRKLDESAREYIAACKEKTKSRSAQPEQGANEQNAGKPLLAGSNSPAARFVWGNTVETANGNGDVKRRNVLHRRRVPMAVIKDDLKERYKSDVEQGAPAIEDEDDEENESDGTLVDELVEAEEQDPRNPFTDAARIDDSPDEGDSVRSLSTVASSQIGVLRSSPGDDEDPFADASSDDDEDADLSYPVPSSFVSSDEDQDSASDCGSLDDDDLDILISGGGQRASSAWILVEAEAAELV